jgi:Ca2+-binding EF-hand superfamily protein
MKKALFAGIAAAAFAATAPSVAQNAPVATAPAESRAPMAREHTRDEVVAKVREHFARLDTNRDGFIVKAEADAAREQLKSKFAENRAERKEHRQERAELRREHTFERLDSNNDDSISRAEFDTAHAQRDGRMAHRGAEGAHRGRMLHGMMRGSMHGMHGRMFEMADLDKDGRVSLQEAQDAAVRHFDMADANKDGRITREERIQRHKQVRMERRPG